jgi:hypothetical protein
LDIGVARDRFADSCLLRRGKSLGRFIGPSAIGRLGISHGGALPSQQQIPVSGHPVLEPADPVWSDENGTSCAALRLGRPCRRPGRWSAGRR